MGWQWVNDLLAPDNKKKMYWEARCPLSFCPSNNQDLYEEGVRGRPRLKFVQKVSFFIYQYKCKDCGNLVNIGMEQPEPEKMHFHNMLRNINPSLRGGRPDYKLRV